MSEPLSIAAQIQVPEKTFNAWLKLPAADGGTVLDQLAGYLDHADATPESPFLCQYLPERELLLLFRSGGRNLDDAAPVVALFGLLAPLAGGVAQGYVSAGRYPCGSQSELACWRVGRGRLSRIARQPSRALAELMPLVEVLFTWMPEQRRHQKKLFFRKLVLRFQALGNAWVRGASPDRPLWYDDNGPYKTDGVRVLYTAWRAQQDAVVEGADPYRLRRLAGRLWADDERLYFKGKAVAVLDQPARVVGQAVVVGNRAYLADRDASELHADDIHPAFFKRLCADGDYYRDDVHVWCGMQGLPERPADFEVMQWGVARGRCAVYLYGRICENVDPASFVALGRGLYQDAQHRWSADVTALRKLGPAIPL